MSARLSAAVIATWEALKKVSAISASGKAKKKLNLGRELRPGSAWWEVFTKKISRQGRQKLNRVSALRIRFGIWFIENLRM